MTHMLLFFYVVIEEHVSYCDRGEPRNNLIPEPLEMTSNSGIILVCSYIILSLDLMMIVFIYFLKFMFLSETEEIFIKRI